MYGHRLWAAPGHFTPRRRRLHDRAVRRRGAAARGRGAAYETASGRRRCEAVPALFERCDVPTLALYGGDDHVVDDTFPDRCRVAFSECIGPFVVPHCGHFVQWEAAATLNAALRWFSADLLAR